ncbi:RNA methyltransferase [bacterium]|nr:RNA methyltransferase [bacterium]
MKPRGSGSSDLFRVEGLASVMEYLRHRPKAVKSVWCTDAASREATPALKEFGVSPKRFVPPKEDLQSGRASPVWAEISLESLEQADFFARVRDRAEAGDDLILALDHVVDPRNVGAMVRSAAFFGVREVLVPERRQALLANASVNTAQGGFALCDLVVVVNLGRALEELKELGYWIIGADMGGESIEAIRSAKYRKIVLVMGSEESGLAAGIRGKCDRMVSIAGRPGGLESLNVSVAAGILMQQLGTSR